LLTTTLITSPERKTTPRESRKTEAGKGSPPDKIRDPTAAPCPTPPYSSVGVRYLREGGKKEGKGGRRGKIKRKRRQSKKIPLFAYLPRKKEEKKKEGKKEKKERGR